MSETDVPLEDVVSEDQTLLRRLVDDIYQAIDLLNRKPNFVDNPVGLKLRDSEINVDKANDHLYDALCTISALINSKHINWKGGE